MRITIGYDKNGNKVARCKPSNGLRAFSIQTLGNLPGLHKVSKTDQIDQLAAYDEILAYVSEYGTKRQKDIIENNQ